MKKRLFFLTAALLMAVVSFAQPRATVEKLWSRTVADIGSTKADSRQAAGFDGTIYVLNKNNHSLVGVTETQKDSIIKTTDGITALDGTAFAIDDAGNFVVEGTFPSTPSHLYIRKADGSEDHDYAITGLARTDYVNAVGDIFSAEGGYVFVYGNGAAKILVYKIVNGAIASTTEVDNAGVAGGNYVIDGNETSQIVHLRTTESGWVKIENGVATTIANMEGFKNSTLGGDIITLGGNEYYIYPSGTTNYSSEFSVRDMTTGVLVADKTNENTTVFYANTATTKDNNYNFCSLIATPIDEYSAYIHVYTAADGLALYKLTVPMLYEIGHNTGWAPNSGKAMDMIAYNVFQTSFPLEANNTFTFVTDLAQNNDQGGWDYINGLRYGSDVSPKVVTNGSNVDLVKDANLDLKVTEAGYYTVTVNFNTNKISVSSIPAKIEIMQGWDSWKPVLMNDVDGVTCTATITLQPGDYSGAENGFKIRINDNGIWKGVYDIFKRKMGAANRTKVLNSASDNAGLWADVPGDYIFTYKYATGEMTVSWPESFTRTAEIGDYQTLCVPFTARVTGAEVYEIKASDIHSGYVTLTAAAAELHAGYSYILKATATTINIYMPGGTVQYEPIQPGGGATGLYGALSVSYLYKYDTESVKAEPWVNNYVLQDDNKVHEVQAGGEVTINSTRAYLHIAGGANAPELRIIEAGNEATNIENVEANEQAVKFIQNGQMFIKKNGVVYDMMGHVVR